MNLIELIIVGACIELQNKIIRTGQGNDYLLDLTDRVIDYAGLGINDWEDDYELFDEQYQMEYLH
jgi:hypothetical protein